MRTMALIIALGVGLAACDSNDDTALGTDTRDPSVARIWNEALLFSISNDFARPTVHARNLWHVSAAMYDAWAAFDDTASTWLLGKTQNGYACDFTPPRFPRDRHRAREEAISFAAYRIIRHRFQGSPGAADIVDRTDQAMADLGYDPAQTSTAYEQGSPAALGNYIAACYLAYGLGDGSNEAMNYAYNVMQKQGYNMITPLDNTVVNQLLRPEKMRYDAKNFTWVGSSAQTNIILVVSTKKGISSVDDWVKSGTELIGSSSGT